MENQNQNQTPNSASTLFAFKTLVYKGLRKAEEMPFAILYGDSLYQSGAPHIYGPQATMENLLAGIYEHTTHTKLLAEQVERECELVEITITINK